MTKQVQVVEASRGSLILFYRCLILLHQMPITVAEMHAYGDRPGEPSRSVNMVQRPRIPPLEAKMGLLLTPHIALSIHQT
jgi:hypothetical protein